MDKGHEKLVEDLKALLVEAEQFAFHDFKNEQFATPKIVLVQRFDTLRQRVLDGTYDN